MSAGSDTAVVVVGAGPTGLTLACELARLGVDCRLVDRAPEPSARSRAIGVSARSLEVLDELGAADELVRRGVPCRSARFYSTGTPLGTMTFSAARHTEFPFMLAVPQPEIEAVLTERFTKLGGRVERATTLRDLRPHPEHVEYDLEGPDGPRTARASWLVGTDGAHSTVRDRAGIGFSGRATGDLFVSVDALLDGGPEHGVGHYHFAPGGLSVIVGLPDGSHRLTALIRGDGRPDQALDTADIRALIRRGTGREPSVRALRDAGWGVSTVRIHSRVATSFAAGRVLLAGDAAHVFGPVGGQGMNSGIQDAQNLAWRLAAVHAGHGAPALVDGYPAERRPVAGHARLHAAGQAALATVRPRPLVTVRDRAFGLLCRAGLVDRRIGPSVTQLETTYGGLAAPVRRLPNLRLGTSSLYDLLGERMITLLVTGAGRSDEPDVDALSAAVRVEFPDVATVRSVGVPVGGRGRAVLLVRPDGFVADRIARTAGPGPVLERLRRLLSGH